MSNTVRAAAEGLPKIFQAENNFGDTVPAKNGFSRRSVLGALATLPVASLPGLAETAEHPDADLFWLDKEMEEADVQRNLAAKACRRIGKKCEKLYPPAPPQWEQPAMPDYLHKIIANSTIHDLKRKTPEPLLAWQKALDEQRAANKALQEAYLDKVDEINRESGVDAAEEALSARVDELYKIGDRIFATPANTLEGILVKLRAVDMMDFASFADENAVFLSISADIRRLAGEAT